MKTVNEAKKMACCKVQAYRESGGLITVACLGATCMAWRWEVRGEKITEKGDRADIRTNRGYCGLAGEPPQYDFTQDEIAENCVKLFDI